MSTGRPSSSIGPLCSELGLTPGTFLEGLAGLSQVNFTNACVLEIHKYVVTTKLQWEAVKSAMSKAYKEDWSGMLACSLNSAFIAVKHQHRKLQKGKNPPKLEDFLQKNFSPPSLTRKRKSPETSAACSTSPKLPAFDVFSESVNKLTSDGLLKDLTSLQQLKHQQEGKIVRLEKEILFLRKENQMLKNKVRLCNPKRFNQMVKRKTESIRAWKDKYMTLCRNSPSVVALQKGLEDAETRLKKVTAAKKKQSRRLKKKVSTVEEALNLMKSTTAIELEDMWKEARCERRSLENDVCCLQEELEDHSAEPLSMVSVQEDGKSFSTDIREASYVLQSLGVAEAKVGEVVRVVCDTVAHKPLADPMPCTTTQAKLGAEMKSLARNHIPESLGDQQNLTLKYDGTTKQGTHLTELELSTGKTTLLAGVRRQLGGKATDYVDTISTALHDVTPLNAAPLLQNVANTMTDQCITNKKVDENLQLQKGGVLNSFRCGAHPLDTIASACELAVREYEKEHPAVVAGRAQLFTRGSESVTHGLVRKVADLFHNEQTGCRELLSGHLLTAFPNATKKIWINRFVGNRLNVLFVDPAATHAYKDILIDYFRNVSVPTNDHQRSVYNTLVSGSCNVALRALGLVFKFVSGPWQRLVDKEIPILELNQYYDEALKTLKQWAEDSSSVVWGSVNGTVFHGVNLTKDFMYTSLTSSCENDADTATVFSSMCTKIVSVMERQLKSQLPGGEFWEPSSELREQAKSCTSTNMSGERVFGCVDALLRRAPNSTCEKIESKLMYSKNNTADWLAQKTLEKKQNCIRQARRAGTLVSREDRKNRLQYKAMLLAKLRNQRQEVDDREIKKREITEKLVQDVVKFGLWTGNNLEHNLQSTRAKMAALKAQINFYTKVFGIQTKSKIALSKANQQELKAHLLLLLNEPLTDTQSALHCILVEPETVVGKQIQHTWKVDQQELVYSGLVLGVVDSEFELQYTGEVDSCFMTRAELITDIVRGDLVVQ